MQNYPRKSLSRLRLGKVFLLLEPDGRFVGKSSPLVGDPSSAGRRAQGRYSARRGCKRLKADAFTAYLCRTSTRGSTSGYIVCNENNDNDGIELSGSYNYVFRVFLVFLLFSE